MAAITENTIDTAGHLPRPGSARMKKQTLRIDMTPMVDLGFLLIAFFVMTSEMNKPAVVDLFMPKESLDNILVKETRSLTVLVGDGRVLYYEGQWEDAVAKRGVKETSLDSRTGIGSVIRAKQQRLAQPPADQEGRDGLVLMIKAGPGASYGAVVNALDEATINGVKHYSLVAITQPESGYLGKTGL